MNYWWRSGLVGILLGRLYSFLETHHFRYTTNPNVNIRIGMINSWIIRDNSRIITTHINISIYAWYVMIWNILLKNMDYNPGFKRDSFFYGFIVLGFFSFFFFFLNVGGGVLKGMWCLFPMIWLIYLSLLRLPPTHLDRNSSTIRSRSNIVKRVRNRRTRTHARTCAKNPQSRRILTQRPAAVNN